MYEIRCAWYSPSRQISSYNAPKITMQQLGRRLLQQHNFHIVNMVIKLKSFVMRTSGKCGMSWGTACVTLRCGCAKKPMHRDFNCHSTVLCVAAEGLG